MVVYFQATLRDDALFPPRCCGQPILDEEESFWLPSPPLMARIKEKEEERQMVDKTYCSNPRCPALLAPTCGQIIKMSALPDAYLPCLQEAGAPRCL